MTLTPHIEKERPQDSKKSIETIINEHPEKNFDKNIYREVLDVLLNTEQERAFLSRELSIEAIRNLSKSQLDELQRERDALEQQKENHERARVTPGEKIERGQDHETAEQALIDAIKSPTKSGLDKGQPKMPKAKEAVSKGGKQVIGIKTAILIKEAFQKVASWLEGIEKKGGFWGMITGLCVTALKFCLYKGSERIKPDSPEFKETITQTESTLVPHIEEAFGTKFDDKTKQLLRKKLNPNEEGSYMTADEFASLAEKIKKGEKITIDDLNKTSLLKNILKDSELKEVVGGYVNQIQAKFYGQLKGYLGKSGITITEGSDKGEKLKNIIAKKVNESTLKKFVENDGGSFADVGLISIETALFIPDVILEMWRENIIETSQLVITLAEGQVDKISIGLKGLGGQDIFPDLVGKISFGALQEKITGLELDDTKKMLLLRAFYSELGLIGAVLGTVGKWGTSGFISLLEKGATVAENVKAGETALKGITELPIKQLQKILETIKPLEGKWLEEIQKSLRLTQESYQVVEEMKTLPKNSPQLTELNNRLGAIEKDIKTTRGKFGFDGVMSRDLTIKNFSPIQYSYMTTTLDDISRIVEANNKLGEAIVNGKITTIYEKFKSFKEQFRLRQIGGNTVFHIADIKEAKALSLALKDLAPGIVRTLFGRLPIILIGGSIFNQAMSGEGDWKETLLAINGFTGGYMLLNEAYVGIKDGKIDLKNTATGALGALVIGTEFCLFWKDIIKYGGIRALPLAVWNSVARIPIAAIETGAWGFAKLKGGAKLLNSIPKKGKLGLLAAVAVGILLYIGVSGEGDVKELEKQGFMKNGELDLEAIKKKWNSLGKEAQEEILKFVFVSSLREPFINKGSEFNFKLENGNFIIGVKKEFLEQNRWIIEESERYLLNVLFSLGADYFVVIKEDN